MEYIIETVEPEEIIEEEQTDLIEPEIETTETPLRVVFVILPPVILILLKGSFCTIFTNSDLVTFLVPSSPCAIFTMTKRSCDAVSSANIGPN